MPFGPKVRAERLLRQSAGLMPPSDTQPASTRPAAIQALLNLQLGAGMITEGRFQKIIGGGETVPPAPATASTRPGSRPVPNARIASAAPRPLVSPFSSAFQRRPQQFQAQALAKRRRPTRVSMAALGGLF
jgi:hypothetical protein